jgi:hypothetical protein
MKKVKTYWDEIKNEEFFLYGGNWGWEIHFRFENVGRYNPKTNEHKYVKSLQPQWPFRYGSEKVPKEEKALCKKEVMQQYKQRKMLAQASRNLEEYRDLHARINKERWEDIVATGFKGINLGNYIRSKYLTEREGYALFYNM